VKVLIAARLSQLHNGETGLDSQEREVIAWAERCGHEVVGVAADHKTGKSNLWDRPNLRPWVREPSRIAQYDAIVAYAVDRLTRADDEGVDAMKAWARENHKQLLISSAEVRFPSEGVEGVRWDMYIRMAHEEWLKIRERYGRMQAFKHESGSLVGRPPWGYEVVRLDGVKTIVPTLEGRIWAPRIFAWIAEGWTSRRVGEELERNGIRSGAPNGRWHEGRIIKLINCQTYTGIRERKGRSGLRVEPLVSRALQDKAVAMLASRPRTGRAASQHPKALLAKLKCGHPDCPGKGVWPMYRIDTSRPFGGYYRCTGLGAQRKGCGAPLIRVDVLDSLVLGFTEYWDNQPYKSQRFVSGNDAGVRLEALRTEMSEALRHAAADKIPAVAADYGTRIAALEAEGSILPHWEDVVSDLTEGQHLRSLELDGQREYLGRKDIRAWKDGDETKVTVDGALARKGGTSGIMETE
jgi:DNA invertase Pin-like site-specific DNA recombinase